MKKLDGERRRALADAKSATEREERKKHFDSKARALWSEALGKLEVYILDRLTAFPREGQLYRLKAEMLALEQRFEEATTAFRHAAEFSGEPDYWRQYIVYLMGRGDHEDAWKTAMDAASRFPDKPVFKRLVDQARDRMLNK
jgi:tetratricopeptide (TPR) repeat protein